MMLVRAKASSGAGCEGELTHPAACSSVSVPLMLPSLGVEGGEEKTAVYKHSPRRFIHFLPRVQAA